MIRIPPSLPLAGDVVVRSCDECPTDYLLSPEPSPAQTRYSAYSRAVDAAKRWACHQHVDVWFADGAKSFVLVSRHRLDEPKGGAVVSGMHLPFTQNGTQPATISHVDDIVHVASHDDTGMQPQPLDVRSVIDAPHPNALLIGSPMAAKELIALFQPHLTLPVVAWDPCVSADPPAIDCGTLVVWNIDRMGPAEQQRLNIFVHDHWPGVQILSVAEHELFNRVRLGEFSEQLYYRLNVLRIHVDE